MVRQKSHHGSDTVRIEATMGATPFARNITIAVTPSVGDFIIGVARLVIDRDNTMNYRSGRYELY